MKCVRPYLLTLVYAEDGSFVPNEYRSSIRFDKLPYRVIGDRLVATISPLVKVYHRDNDEDFLEFDNLHDFAEVHVLEVPCHKCALCLQAKANERVQRFVVEAKGLFETHEGFSLTLTYNDLYLPYCSKTVGGVTLRGIPTLRYRDIQLFLKEIRRGVSDIRFLCSCEYGRQSDRPHYHLLLLVPRSANMFADRFYLKKSPAGDFIYSSPWASSRWYRGFVTIQELTEKSAFYSSGYVHKVPSFVVDKEEWPDWERERVVCSLRLGWRYVDELSSEDSSHNIVYGTYNRNLFGSLGKRLYNEEQLREREKFAKSMFAREVEKSGLTPLEYRNMLNRLLLKKQEGHDE